MATLKRYSSFISLLGVRLLARLSSNELRDLIKVLHDWHNVWELCHVDVLAFSVVNLGGKERVSHSDDVTETIFALSLLDHLLKGGESSNDCPLSPRLSVLLAKPGFYLLQNTQVLDRLSASIDHFAETTDLETFDRVFREELSLIRIAFLKEFADCHRLGQRNWLLDNVFILDDQAWHHL